MADTLDTITLAAAKQAINMAATDTVHDVELARQVTAVSRLMDATVGPVVRRTITAEIHDGGLGFLELRHQPVSSITLVRENSGGTITTVTAAAFGGTVDGYYADPWYVNPALLSGVLHRRYGGYSGPWLNVQVEVTYVAGRYADTATVDARFVECAAGILRRLWKREAGAWAQSPDFYQQNDLDVGAGFFRVARPLIEEMLADQLPLPGVA